MDLAHRREEYETAGLDLGDIDPDPIVQFERWYRDAEAAELWEPNAVVVSTVDPDGWPSARYVLMKGFDSRGFVFYTNYRSAKAVELETAGRASMTFGWLPLRRQIRVRGRVERVSTEESDDYFTQRPRGAQLSAWASPQSEVVVDRAELDGRFATAADQFGTGPIARPDHWGGYRVAPLAVEFWQGRPNRFHDRLRYDLDGAGDWIVSRLAP